ncbi:MAG: hypothetical protein KJ893_07510 [Candidatus Omnitrophica bacterium]|nr:hypothetical protein [Candidatus Omnitrophota bacterium]
MSAESPRVEFITHNGVIEVRYFDTPKDERYRSWRLPESLIGELITFRTMLKKHKKIAFPLQKRTKVCEFAMHTEKHIEIKSLDCRGRTNMTGWSLPNAVVEELIIWRRKEKIRRYKQW